VVHLLLLALLVSHGERLWSRTLAPGDAALRGGRGALSGGGGNRVAYITLPSLPEPEPTVAKAPPVRPPKAVVVAEADPAPTAPPAAEVVDTAPVQPEPRDMAFPFDNPPKELRGVSLSVTFWVRVDGRVERYQVVPEIKDRDYAKKFDEVMRAFRFTPARAPDGTWVAGTTKISFTLPGKSSS
jgi:hypothetical protein